MSSAPPPPRRGAAMVALVLTALLVAGAATFEVLSEPFAPGVAETVEVDEPTSGIWYCPVVAGAEEEAVLSVLAVGDLAADVTVLRYDEGVPRPEETVRVSPGDQFDRILPPGRAQFPVAVAWQGAPVVASWRVEGRDAAGGPCAPAPSDTWYVTGFDTTGRSRSTLHLFNPFGVDAVARVTFGTPAGRVALVLTDSLLVQAGTVARVNLGDFEPQQPDLAVTVEVTSGRLVAGGEVALEPTANQPGPSGRAVLPGVAEPGMEHASGYGRAGDGASSWLSVYNPGEREAAVELHITDPLPDGPALLAEQSVPAGGVARIDLADTSGALEHGVTVTSVNEQPVVVSHLTHVRTGAGAQGLAASLAQTPRRRWAIAGGGSGDRQGRVSLYNPGTEPITVTVSAGGQTPAEWSTITVEPNTRRALELRDAGPDRAAVGLRLSSDGLFVPSLRLQGVGGALRFWIADALPAEAWRGPTERPPVRRDPLLDTRPLVPEATPTTVPTASPELEAPATPVPTEG